jgi:hypothetical protein
MEISSAFSLARACLQDQTPVEAQEFLEAYCLPGAGKQRIPRFARNDNFG